MENSKNEMIELIPYSAAKIANEFIDLARVNGERLTPMQILKLVYIAHGWVLALLHRPLVRQQDRIEAWKFGPVIPNLYHETKEFGNGPVTKLIGTPIGEQSIDAKAKDMIRQVYDIYGSWSGPELSSLTHQDGTPWSQIWNSDDSEDLIPDYLITAHYTKKKQNG